MNQLVETKQGKAITTSLKIAEVFGKNHAHVLRDIESLDIPEEFNQSNFGLVSYTDKKGEVRKAYELTKDGFTLLAMGYTGAKAMQFKIAYINAFNAMYEELGKRTNSSDSLYFEQKKQLVQQKHNLDVEISGLINRLNAMPEGIELAQKQDDLRKCKHAIGQLEAKYFRYRYTLFPELEFK